MNSKLNGRSDKRTDPLAAMLIVLIGGFLLLLFGIAVSISVGAVKISLDTVWQALVHFDPGQNQHLVVKDLRLPRALAGAVTGASFSVAGAVMQGMTRNPLADSGLLGLNAGAGLVLALCLALAPGLPYSQVLALSFAGAALGAGLVYGISSMARGGMTPLRLTVAGAAVSSLLLALSEGVALLFRIGQDLAFWYAGGLAGTQWMQVRWALPCAVAGLAAAVWYAKPLTLMSMGDEVATGLGQKTGRVRAVCTLAVLVLAGTAVSLAGPVAFIGLIIPHVARILVGTDYRFVIPCSAMIGSLLMVYADIAGRMVRPPYETPIGALIAIIGVPVFLIMARTEKKVF
ncbi:FecCD family ABC transporter permease [Cohnella candidum]|uniref:Iron ABC transporter permease n=1 Tax=Cohnella candidum TaxID=2674991 RepID=A0A3G3JXG8_9BACL|nr:iron ABC transporter permease [Cohnella candidum]AYQ72936.1 iron ABC transporter permease [Cohnella candidum]